MQTADERLLGQLADRYMQEAARLRDELAVLQAKYDRLAKFCQDNAGPSPLPRRV